MEVMGQVLKALPSELRACGFGSQFVHQASDLTGNAVHWTHSFLDCSESAQAVNDLTHITVVTMKLTKEHSYAIVVREWLLMGIPTDRTKILHFSSSKLCSFESIWVTLLPCAMHFPNVAKFHFSADFVKTPNVPSTTKQSTSALDCSKVFSGIQANVLLCSDGY